MNIGSRWLLPLLAILCGAALVAGGPSPSTFHARPGRYTGTFNIHLPGGGPWPAPFGSHTLPPPTGSSPLIIVFTVSGTGTSITRLAYWSYTECKGEGSPVQRGRRGIPIGSDGRFRFRDDYNSLRGVIRSNGTASGTLKANEAPGPCDEATGKWHAGLKSRERSY